MNQYCANAIDARACAYIIDNVLSSKAGSASTLTSLELRGESEDGNWSTGVAISSSGMPEQGTRTLAAQPHLTRIVVPVWPTAVRR